MTRRDFIRLAGVAAMAGPLVTGCAVNPVTGQSQLMLMSRDEENRSGPTAIAASVFQRSRRGPGQRPEQIRGRYGREIGLSEPSAGHALFVSRRERHVHQCLRLSRRKHRRDPRHHVGAGQRSRTGRIAGPRNRPCQRAAHGIAHDQGHHRLGGRGRGGRGGGHCRVWRVHAAYRGHRRLGNRTAAGKIQPRRRAPGRRSGHAVHAPGQIQSARHGRPHGHSALPVQKRTIHRPGHVRHPSHVQRTLRNRARQRGGPLQGRCEKSRVPRTLHGPHRRAAAHQAGHQGHAER